MVYIGTHTSTQGGLYKAYERANKLHCQSMQIFTRNQRQWVTKPLTIDEVHSFTQAQKESCVIKTVSHASYLINLAGKNDIRKKSEVLLIEELNRCSQLGVSDVILHPGFAGQNSERDAICRIAESLDCVFDQADNNVRILLETMAGQGTVIGRSIEQISSVIKMSSHKNRLGICFDTCHVFAAGYKLDDKRLYDEFIDLIDSKIGLDKLGCIHLNDSKHELGTKKDRHEHIGKGFVGIDAFIFIMQDDRLKNVPGILETPKEDDADQLNMALLKSFRK